jgi:hypothetical protein
MNSFPIYPVGIGGVGGGGTRVVATLLRRLGYYLGDDLNEAEDNLWFTLLFKRRAVLLESDADFASLVSLFFARMSGRTTFSKQECAVLTRLAEKERLQHSREWLQERAESFFRNRKSIEPYQPWCWKEPNTHVVIERMFVSQPNLRYFHVVRHPLEMALSLNQNQLQNWGPIFLDSDVDVEPRFSLSYWCAAHRRILNAKRNWPDRIMMIDFDALCMTPDLQCLKIARFLGTPLPRGEVAKLTDFIRRPASVRRFKYADLGQFRPDDLAYLAEVGYWLPSDTDHSGVRRFT